MKYGSTRKKLTCSIALIVLLVLCLCVTLMALLYSMVSVDGNRFLTGVVEINLNDGKPVIEANEFLFEPGMTVEKTFFVENNSGCEVYCRLYFDSMEGNLANVMDVTLLSGNEVLFSGKASDFTRKKAKVLSEKLGIRERKEFSIVFYFPKEVGSNIQGGYLAFDLRADATQVRNNPKRQFE